MDNPASAQEIDAIIMNTTDWRGQTLARLRATVLKTNPSLTETVKWKKPSKPEGVPVWEHDGIVCLADTLKNAVRLTFPNGAKLKDPQKIFNSRLDGNAVRAIDFVEDSTIDEAALQALVHEAIELNASKDK
jgi:hypothetical protein